MDGKDIEKRIQELEKRQEKTEKRVEMVAGLALSVARSITRMKNITRRKPSNRSTCQTFA